MMPSRDRSGNTSPTDNTLRPAAPFVSNAYRYPFPFERFEAPGLVNYTAYPYSAVGKLFGTDANGDFQCSGSVINSANRSVVWTAGHCVTYHGADIQQAIFVPGYKDGTAPFGIWTADSFWASRKWQQDNNPLADFAALVLAPDATGRSIVNVTGGLGIEWGISAVQHWHAMGYPAVSPFDGERQWTCTASQAAYESFGRRFTLGIGCDFTGGSSGGPWIESFGAGNFVNGLVTYGYSKYPKAIFGPYFGDAVGTLFNCATDGVC